ncbi:MAG: twin-arginine translocation signal domain-containing protein [Planctomycetota bacterium]|jgi:hypothetical protein
MNSQMNCFSKSCLSRRQFLGGCAAGAIGVSVGSALASAAPIGLDMSAAPAFGGRGEKVKVRIVLMYPSPKRPIWPNIGYNFDGHNKQFVANLRKGCPGIEFSIDKLMTKEDAQAIAKKDAEVDGYLVYMSGCLWGGAADTIADLGKPMVFVDHLYAGSGAFLTSYGKYRRNGQKVVAVSSSRIEDVVESARCIETVVRMRSSKVLVVGRKADQKIQEVLGTRMKPIELAELGAASKRADEKMAAKNADQWMKAADRIVEPSRGEIVKSAKMYLGMCELLETNKAQAITVNCLGGFYGGHLSAYPCLGFMQLNNDGFIGACEGDQKSTITMLLMTYLTGRPGYISDPVIDTAKNQIIYAHCVAPTKVFGPKGSENKYHLRSHSEDRKGACSRSLMPLGEMTTTLLFDAGKKQVIMHQGLTVENVDEDMACRNKLAVEVKGDVFKLLNEWDQWGWHRVTLFGDYKRAVYQLAGLLGFGVLEEA